MSASHARSGWFSRSMKSVIFGLAVMMIVAAMNPGTAEARRRGRSSKYAKTPSGKVMKHRPSLQVGRQG